MRTHVCCWLLVTGCFGGFGQVENPTPSRDASVPGPDGSEGLPCEVAALLRDRCANCHGADGPQVSLVTGAALRARSPSGATWGERALARISNLTMPPRPASGPAEPPVRADQLAALSAWVKAGAPPTACTSTEERCPTAPAPQHTMIHRLSGLEYDNSVRDLLFVEARRGRNVTSTGSSHTGFSNDSEALEVTPPVVADLVSAAIETADEVVATRGQPNGPFAKLMGTCNGTYGCTTALIRSLADRAFRRPVDHATFVALVDVYEAGYLHQGRDDFAAGLHDVLVALLIDPRFLFSYVEHPRPDDAQVIAPLGSYELAARLAHFLWQSLPDDELRRAAGADELRTSQGVTRQVRRMLADAKAKSFVQTWRREWAHLTELDNGTELNGVDAPTVAALRDELDLAVGALLEQDAPVMSLVSAGRTFVNARLVDHYGWSGAQGSSYQPVAIPEAGRRGVLMFGGTMLAVGGGTETHPVIRGKWVLENLLCEAPPPPPPDVQTSLDTTAPDGGTPRERLAVHRTTRADCASCHVKMDAYGLALENFDRFGRWRAAYLHLGNTPIDASGSLPDGTTFAGPGELATVLAENPAVARCLTKKLTTLALTRDAEANLDDRCVVRRIADEHARGSFSALVSAIVLSPSFQLQRGSTAQVTP